MTTQISIQEANYVDPRAGNDKFYRVFVVGPTWLTQYGRNGTLGTFTKVIDAGSPAAAQSAASKKFAEKVKKGYNPVRSGEVNTVETIELDDLSLLDTLAQSLPLGDTHTIVTEPINPVTLTQPRRADLIDSVQLFLSTSDARATTTADFAPTMPTRPMLASVQPESVVTSAMADPNWVAQYKYDGDRVVIEVTNGEIRVLNRQGQEKTKNVGHSHLHPFTALYTGRWIFDGEVVGRTLVIFDLIFASDWVSTWVDEQTSFRDRYTALGLIATALDINFSTHAAPEAAVVLAPRAINTEEKFDFLTTAIKEQREGIILRHNDAPYESGRRSTTLIKHKLIKDADVIVTALHATKDSATLSVYGPNDQLIEVGAASTIGKGSVAVGDIWVVTFLYVTDPAHPRLFQPRLVNKRGDKSAAECLLSQFADAGTNKLV